VGARPRPLHNLVASTGNVANVGADRLHSVLGMPNITRMIIRTSNSGRPFSIDIGMPT
jgi:hypothetical protein